MVGLAGHTPNKMTTRTVTTLGILIAVTVVIAMFFVIPIPWTHGNINLCDAGIFIAALLYGRRGGALVGGASGFLLDLLTGYSQYMLFSLVVHGLEGLIVGWFGAGQRRSKQVAAIAIGGLVMVVGYFITDSIMFKLPTGLLGIPMNLLQALVGGLIAYPLVRRFEAHLKKQFRA